MYIATQSFKAINGVTYRMGDIIEDEIYANLSDKDKAKCKLKKKVTEENKSEVNW
jgi:hypothetical protein